MSTVKVKRNADGVEMIVSKSKYEEIKDRFTLVKSKAAPKKKPSTAKDSKYSKQLLKD